MRAVMATAAKTVYGTAMPSSGVTAGEGIAYPSRIVKPVR